MSTDWPFDEPAVETGATANVAEFTVSELSAALRRTVEDTYGYVRVRGELGRVSRPGSGHVYLDLKDDKSVLAGVIWKGVAQGMRIKPEQGLEVVVTGKLTTFAGQSKYQIVIDSMEPAGVGALMALLEERRKKLAAEGLFDADRKQQIPYLPRVIGVVTSPTGAVIRDIMHRIADRFPTRILVWPVRVQGEKSAGEVANAIAGFNALDTDGDLPRPDLIIVARGGGSLEDLWGFNEENVVRAAAASDIPLISAVGHETDWTLIDHVADERAPTPTAAAERAVPVRADLVSLVTDLNGRMARGLWRIHEERKAALLAASRGLPKLADLLAVPRQRFDATADRLPRALRASTQVARTRLTEAAARLTPRPLRLQVQRYQDDVAKLHGRAGPALERSLAQKRAALLSHTKLLGSLSYKSVLHRGFALVHGPDGKPLGARADATPGLEVEIEFHDGRAAARVEGDAPAPKAPRKTARKDTTPGGQGSLF
jgi:exodeoxyribonuclease VII large subunit